jgi:hypothetical protein
MPALLQLLKIFEMKAKASVSFATAVTPCMALILPSPLKVKR